MTKSVSFEFVNKIIAERPKGNAVLVALESRIVELVKTERGRLWIREMEGFMLTDKDPVETDNMEITGYWYLPREGYVQKQKKENR